MSQYGSFPYYSPSPTPQQDPTYQRKPTPQVRYGPITSGEFILNLIQNTVIDVGTSARFNINFAHIIDGTILPTGVTLAIFDANGNAASVGITVGTVTQNSADAGGFFSVVQFTTACPVGYYEVYWTGTYTPVNNQEPNIPLPISSPRIGFYIRKMAAPSQWYFFNTKHL